MLGADVGAVEMLRLPTLELMGGEWACSFSRLSAAPEAPLGSQPSAAAAKHFAEQDARAHRREPVGSWIQAERVWFLETSDGTYIVARQPAVP
jgi:hypothetical protein